jgi:deoxyribonuclease V
MKLAVCVHFHGDKAVAAGVAFDEWDAPEASRTFTSRVAHVDKPSRAELDLRALPCLMLLLQEHALRPDVILIDAPVHLDASETPGLGRKLYEALGGQLAIIGVSTKSIPGMPAQFEVFREEEARPVIVTSVGVDIGAAKTRVRAMHGKRRIPTLLKLAARIARESST